MKKLWRKLLFRFRRARFERELEEEIDLHRDLREGLLRERGLGAGEAAAEAKRQFGSGTGVRETSREIWSWRWLDELGQNARFACRLFVKSPGFTLAATLTLALGIGANTAVFSILDGVLLRPLPYRDPDRLVVIWDRMTRGKNTAPIFASYGDFEQVERYAKSFSSVSAATWAAGPRAWSNGKTARSLLVVPTTQSFFATLGVQAKLGRTFNAADERRACAVMLSDAFWREKLAAKPNIIGSDLTLDDRPCTVVGVMPVTFSFYPRQTPVWMLAGPHMRPAREKLIVGIFARLRPGVTIAQAQSEVTSLHRTLHEGDASERDVVPAVFNLQDQFTFLASRTLRTTIWLFLGAVLFVLLIACLNVANLLLGRSVTRERELAVRAALGSGKTRLVRQLLTEAVLLGLLASGLGVALAFAAIGYFRQVNPIELPVGADVRINAPVLLFTGVLSLGSALLFGLLPALRASRVDLNQALKASGRSAAQGFARQSLARGVVAAEVALSMILLTGAGVLIVSLLRMGSENLGFDPHGLATIRASLRGGRYASNDDKTRFYDELLSRVRSKWGRDAAALSSRHPYNGELEIEIGGKPRNTANGLGDVASQAVSADYFALQKTALLAGRTFREADRSGSQAVAIVNGALAREYFPDGNVVGRQIRIALFGEKNSAWLTVVGVVASEKHTELMREMAWVETPVVFRPIAQDPQAQVEVSVRTPREAATERSVQDAIAAIDPSITVGAPETAEADVAEVLAFPRFRAMLLGVFALAALLLSAVGLHGVLSQSVTQRTPEFGIRMAIGAKEQDIFLLVARQGGVPVFVGLLGGLCGAFGLERWMASLLFEIRATDPRVLGAVTIFLLLVAAGAMTFPARRAARVDPAVALRNE